MTNLTLLQPLNQSEEKVAVVVVGKVAQAGSEVAAQTVVAVAVAGLEEKTKTRIKVI